MPAIIELKFLGPPQVFLDGREVTTLLDRKEIALLAYLAVQPAAVLREAAADLLWGELGEDEARQNLRQASYTLRRLLPGVFDRSRRSSFITLTDIVLKATDVRLFQTLIHQDSLEPACALYRGRLLDGLTLRRAAAFDDWLDTQRRAYERLALEALRRAMAAAADRRDNDALERHARQTLALDSLQEDGYRQLMLALGRRGRFNEALQTYEACATTLRRELNLPPMPETTAIYDRVLLARAAPPRELPFRGLPFIGREREVADATTRLLSPDGRLLTLLGPGGVGKTRLAVEVAHRLRHAFLHGVAYVPLEAQAVANEENLLAAIALGLGIKVTSGQARTQIAGHLRPRELLLVLDNFEAFAPISGALTAFLRGAPQLRILLTSRQRLDVPDEAVYLAGGLAYPPAGGALSLLLPDPAAYDAVALFVHVATRLDPAFDAAAAGGDIGRICRLVEGLPLAIEMVASWTLHMSCAAIVERLAADMPDLLAYQRNFPDRHRTLHGVFEHSWATLPAAEQRAFRRLAVIVGGITTGAAEAIAGATPGLLRGLARKSLVETPSQGQYALHPLLRAFALDKLTAAGEGEATRLAHYDYFHQYVATRLPRLHGFQQLATLNQLAEALDNIRAAWRYGSEHAGEASLLVLLDGLARLFNARNWYALGIEVLREAAGPVARRGLDGVRGRLILQEGRLHYWQGNYDSARQLAEAGLPLAEGRGDEWGVVLALRVLASLLYDNNHYDEAESLWRRALAIASRLGDWESAADCHIMLGNAVVLKTFFSPEGKKPYKPPRPFFMEHYPPSEATRAGAEAAIAHFSEALRLYTAGGDAEGVARCWGIAGFPQYVLHNYEAAAVAYREAIARFRQLAAAGNLGQSLIWLAWVLMWQGKPDEARPHFHEALRVEAEAYVAKRLLDCLQKYSLFLWVTDRVHFMPLAINAFVAQHPNVGARMGVVAAEWLATISDYMRQDEGPEAVERALAHGRQHTLMGLVDELLAAPGRAEA